MSIFHVEDGFFGQPKVQEAYNIINFRFLMENSILKKSGSVDVKITSVLKGGGIKRKQKESNFVNKCITWRSLFINSTYMYM